MSHLTTELLEALAQKQDIEEVFRRHLETAINQLLKHELTTFLDYEPYEQAGVTPVIPAMGFMIERLRRNMAIWSYIFPEIATGHFSNKPWSLISAPMIRWNSLSFTCMKRALRQMKLLI